MKKKDTLWVLVMLVIYSIFIIPSSREAFETMTKAHPYVMAFIKFAVLASMGELLGLRLSDGDWIKQTGMRWRVLIWGILGATTAFGFPLFDSGVRAIVEKGLLPVFGSGFYAKLTVSFYTSFAFNVYFASAFMLVHRIMDTYIELGGGKISQVMSLSLEEVLEEVEWKNLIGFVFMITLPFFWIPVHTITFMLPPEYRILMAASLSIVLGIIMSFRKVKC